jgi:hypothetical protein
MRAKGYVEAAAQAVREKLLNYYHTKIEAI